MPTGSYSRLPDKLATSCVANALKMPIVNQKGSNKRLRVDHDSGGDVDASGEEEYDDSSGEDEYSVDDGEEVEVPRQRHRRINRPDTGPYLTSIRSSRSNLHYRSHPHRT